MHFFYHQGRFFGTRLTDDRWVYVMDEGYGLHQAPQYRYFKYTAFIKITTIVYLLGSVTFTERS